MTIVLDWGHVHENYRSDLHSTWVCVQHWYASSVYQYSWFHLSINVNSYNNRYWPEENPMLIHEEPSNDWKNRSSRRKESTQDIAFSISPAALQYGINNVFIMCDECL